MKKRIGGSINSRSRFSEQVRLKNSKGEYAWFETNAAIVFEDNVPVGFQSSTRDITQRKKAEKIIELTTKKKELYQEISELDLLVAKRKDEYRKIINEIRKLDSHYLSNAEIH